MFLNYYVKENLKNIRNTSVKMASKFISLALQFIAVMPGHDMEVVGFTEQYLARQLKLLFSGIWAFSYFSLFLSTCTQVECVI